MQKRKQKQSSIKMVDYHDGDATWRRFHEEIMENEISLLESYFCKPGEFSKEINVTSSEFTLKINIYLNIMEEEFTVQTMLRIQSNDLKWNFIENQNNLSLQCKNNNIPIEIPGPRRKPITFYYLYMDIRRTSQLFKTALG